MREVGFALLVGAACGSVTTPASGEVRVPLAAPTISHAAFAVSPAELGDANVWARIRHRVRVARIGHAAFAVSGPRVDERTMANSSVPLPIYPVIGESGDRVRVVVEDDFARLALWIPRTDCWAFTMALTLSRSPSGSSRSISTLSAARAMRKAL